MLEQTASDGITRLRFYRWSSPTVSLGYFQRFKDFQAYLEGIGLASSEFPLSVVRRATGGGAIVHHHDWTYSIAMSADQSKAIGHGHSNSLYDSAHRAVVAWLKRFEIEAELWSQNLTGQSKSASQTENCGAKGCPFLCFQRRHAGDVVLAGFKIMGSAQRRLASAILQHGSLLLATSPFADSLPGVADLRADLSHDLKGFAGHFLQQFSGDFGIEFQCCNYLETFVPISPTAFSRFESSAWTARI